MTRLDVPTSPVVGLDIEASPGSLHHDPSASCDTRPGCITCGDVAVELVVVHLLGDDTADVVCRDGWDRTEIVATELVGAVAVGEHLLVHAGVALERLADPAEPTVPSHPAEEAR